MKKIILLILSLFLIIGCGEKSKQEPKKAAIKINDFLGREITLNKPAERIISAAPNITEIIYAIGGENQLVAVSNWCDYPKEAKSKPNFGDFANPSLERIVTLKPDVVFASTQKENPTLDKFNQMGLKVICIHPESFDELLRAIKIIGETMGKETQADSLIQSMKSNLTAIPPPEDTLRVYMEIYSNPLMTVSNKSFLGDMITLAGGKNIGAELPQAYPTVNAEVIVAADPQIIITSHPGAGVKDIRQRLGWENISAVKTGNIIVDIDPNLLLRPGPRAIDGIKAINAAITKSGLKE